MLQEKKYAGILCALATSIAYGTLPFITVIALDSGLSANQVVAYRFIIAAIGAFLYTIISKISVRICFRQFLDILFFVAIGFGSTELFLTLSYLYMPTSLTTIFHFTYPLMVILACTVFFREKITKAKLLSVVVILCGIAFLADWSGSLSAKGVFFALASAVAYALYFVGNRKPSISELPEIVIIFYGMLLSSAFFLFSSILTDGFLLPDSLKVWSSLIASALVCTVLPLILMTKAIRILGATQTSIINMLEPVVGVLCGITFLHEPFSVRLLVGMLFILFGSFLSIFF